MGDDKLSSWLKAKGKRIAVPKKKKDVKFRSGGQLVINEGGSRERRPSVVQDSDDESETEDENETEDESMEEEQEPPRQEQVHRFDDPKEAFYKATLEALRKADIFQTRWVDVGLLKRLGIFEDVRMILEAMGLDDVLKMNYVCYPEQTRELIASFQLHLRRGATTPRELGRVTFRVDNQVREVSLFEVCAAYGFPQMMGRQIGSDVDQDKLIWEMIGQGDYSVGRIKSIRIGNPAIRYVHKILANTLYARYETDKILEDEIALLSNGLQPFFREHFESKGIVGYEGINLGIVLAYRIVYLQSWARKEQNKKSKLLMGGFLTPLLKAGKVQLREPREDNRLWLDFAALKRMKFFDGKEGRTVLYRYVGPDLKEHTVLLPNQAITRLNNTDNLGFARAGNPDFALGTHAEASLPMEEDEEQVTRHSTSDLPLGSPRYYYRPYQGTVRSKASKHILDNLDKSQRWHKWSSRNFHNIKRAYKKQVNAFKEEIAGLKRMVRYLVKMDHPPVLRDGEPDWDYAKEEARRYSTSNIPYSSWSARYHHHEASSHAEPSRRKQRHRQVQPPSPPASDNPSIHLSSSEDEY